MVTAAMHYNVVACGATDMGQVRENNEDFWGQIPEIYFYVLADGMGGHQAGEVAAEQAVKFLCEIVKDKVAPQRSKVSFHDMRKLISNAIQRINADIYKMSRLNSRLRGMGTTLCCLFFIDKGLVYGHVGDSRIYRMRKGKLEQLTKDHSLLYELFDFEQDNNKGFIDLPYKNIITKAVGTEPYVEPTVHLCDVEIGDRYLMCSDGLSDMLSLKEIQSILTQGMKVDDTVLELIATANAHGGYDNITVVLAQVEENGSKNLPRQQ